MRRLYALCAISSLALSTLAVASPAQAAFHLIRWDGTGVCQIWDASVPTTPWPSYYKRVSKQVPTFEAALSVKNGMLKKGTCSL